MKRDLLLRRNTLYGLILAWAMLMVSPYGRGAPPGSAPGSVRAAKHAELTAKYGLTRQQLLQYDKLQEERKKAFKSVNTNPNLSSRERSKQIKAIIHDFEKKMSSVMNREQYEKWIMERKRIKEQTNKVAKELGAKIEQIRKSDIPFLQQQEQIAAAEAEYVQKAAMISGNQKNADGKLKTRHTQNKMTSQGKNNLKMSFNQTKRLQTLTDEKNRKLAELKGQKLPKARHNVERDKILAGYDASVRKLLGDQKFAQWDKNRNTTMDRNLKSRYGMTPEQTAKYKELLNARAIDRYKISHSKLPKAERAVKRKEIDARYEVKLKEILTADQYRKMTANKAYSEQRKAAKEML